MSSLASVQSAVGWTLVHDAWALSVIAGAVAIARSIIPENRPELRYRCLVAGLLGMVGANAYLFISFIQTGPTAALPTQAALQTQGSAHHWIASLTWIWSIGALFLLARYLVGACEVRTLRRSCRIVETGPWVDFVRRVEREYGRVRMVSIATSHRAKGPMLIGLLRPIIVLPPALLCSIPPAQVEMILRHELAHAYRLDNLVLPLQRVAEALLFLHPAVWWISRHISLERELCCDQRALAAGGTPDQYVEALLSAARPSSYVAVHASMANDHVLSRVHRVLLKKDLPMKPSKRAFVIFALCLPLLSGLGFSAVSHDGKKAKAKLAPAGAPHHQISGAKCSDCHVTATPTPQPSPHPFNHEIATRGMQCSQCHTTANATEALQAPSPNSEPPRSPHYAPQQKDDFVPTFSHAAFQGQDCSSCHAGAKPKPAPSPQPFIHPGLPGHDEASKAKCSDCHAADSTSQHYLPKSGLPKSGLPKSQPPKGQLPKNQPAHGSWTTPKRTPFIHPGLPGHYGTSGAKCSDCHKLSSPKHSRPAKDPNHRKWTKPNLRRAWVRAESAEDPTAARVSRR